MTIPEILYYVPAAISILYFGYSFYMSYSPKQGLRLSFLTLFAALVLSLVPVINLAMAVIFVILIIDDVYTKLFVKPIPPGTILDYTEDPNWKP